MSSSLKEYLKKYTSEEKPKTKKKKKQQKNTENKNNGVLIVDEDPMWQAQIKEESSEEDFPDEKPQVEEDVEVKRMRRLEQLKAQRPYLAVAGDGSGWVTVSDTKKAENNDISDVSVRDRHDSPDFSPPRKTLVESDDISPPRKHEREKPYSRSHDLSPSRKPSLTSPDLSPPRKHEKDAVAEKTRNVRHDSPDISESADLSPPRNHNKHAAFVRNKDIQTRDDALADGRTGKRKVRHDSPDISEPQDLSPPRKHNRNSTSGRSSEDFPNKSYSMRDSRISSDLSPPRKHVKDISPERRNSKRVFRGSSDLSPTRKQLNSAEKGKSESKHHDSPDLSRRKFNSRQDSFSRGAKMDISSPRRNRSETDQDISPPRKSKNDSKFSTNGDLKGKGKCIDGSIAGLRSQKELKEEIDRKRQDETQRFLKMDPSLSGRDAGTVYRDKQGRKLEGLEEFVKLQKGPPKPEEKPLEWRKGLAQKREAEARQAELELERNKPFARSRDDPDLDNMLKERVRWGDPMAHLVKRKKEEPVLENLAEDEKLRESGFIVPQNIPEHSWLKRGVDAPPNRYGIKPGRHWDGVDRSNGFEKQQFKRQSEKKATQTEAYLWSVADM